jgi:hypothetical protein
MKGEFESFDIESCKGRDGSPKLHFSASGVITINAAAVTLTGLKTGNKVRLLKSKRNPKEWYMSRDDKGFPLRSQYDKKCKGLMFNSAITVKALMHALNVNKGFGVRIGLQPDEDGWWSLITSEIKI